MNCCVPLCRNTGANHPITAPVHDGRDRITFNRFPTTASQRALWLETLGLTESDLPPGAAVCSEHFKMNDFTVMDGGVVKLNKDSIPLQFCMICLASGHSKLYPMSQNYLEKAYTSLTGIAVSYIRDKIATLPRLCPECAQRLANCDRFREKSLRTYKALLQILQNDEVLTSHNLKSVDRVGKLLTTNILKHTFEPDHYDLYVKYNEEDIKIHLKEEYNSDIEENTEMKREKCDDSEKNAKEFYVEFLTEPDEFQNDALSSNGINNDDKVNCDKNKNTDNCDDINNGDSTNRDICDAGLTHNVVQIINNDKFDDDDIIFNPDITNVTNDEFIISNGDDKVKCLDDYTKHDENNYCDDMNQHNNVLVKKSCRKHLNRSKVGNESRNRVILKNVIFVKDSKPNKLDKDLKPRTDQTNVDLQFPRVHKKAKYKNKNMNNAQTVTNNENTEKNINETTENVKLINRLPSVFREKKIKKSGGQLSSKSKTLKTHVPKPKKRNSIGKLFTKTILTYEEQLAEIQRRKHTEHYEAYTYKCDICFTGRWSLFTYNRHMDKHTDKFGKLECAICGFRYKSRTWLTRHVRSHAERYSCKRCNFVSGTRSVVRLHARWHSGVAFKCPHCDLKFSKRSTYFSHVRLKHPSDCACPLCGFSFVSEHGVKAHINFSHPFETLQNLSGPSCAQCNVRFSSEAAYDTHMAVSPKHVSSGIPQRNQSTSKCQSRKGRPQSKRSLAKQVKLCEACGKSFQNVTLLNQHMNLHAGVKPYKCDLCNKSYFNKFSLRYHCQLTHSDSPRCYPCSVCHREFSFWSNRQRHMLTHNPKRPLYTCDICNKSFASLASKVSHVAHVHNQVPRPKRHRPQRHASRRKHGDASDAQDANVIDNDAQDASVIDNDDTNVAS